MATQWSIKRSQWVRRAVWFCGPVAHWWCSCLYGPVALKRFNKILYRAIFVHWLKYGFREDKMIDTRIMTKAVIYVIFTLLGSRVIPGQVQVLFRTAVFFSLWLLNREMSDSVHPKGLVTLIYDRYGSVYLILSYLILSSTIICWKCLQYSNVLIRKSMFKQTTFCNSTSPWLWARFVFRYSLVLTWISNYMLGKVWDEITYPFPNFNGFTVEVWERISYFIPHFTRDVITYSSNCLWTNPRE